MKTNSKSIKNNHSNFTCMAVMSILILTSGCALKVLNIENSTINKKLNIQPGEKNRAVSKKVDLKVEKLNFINGKGHEFEDALQFEAYKNLRSSRDYAKGKMQWIVDNFIQQKWIVRVLEDKKGYEILQEIDEEYAKYMYKLYSRYFVPNYLLFVEITPLNLNKNSEKTESSTYNLDLGEHIETFIGFHQPLQILKAEKALKNLENKNNTIRLLQMMKIRTFWLTLLSLRTKDLRSSMI